MADKHADEAAPSVSIDALREILREVRKPVIDEELAARKERERQRNRAEQDAMHEAQQARWSACGHLREDNTSAIAWLRHSDDVVRGVCQRCQRPFRPDQDDYAHFLRIPTRAPGVVY